MRITKTLVAMGLVLVAGAAHATNGMRMIGFGPIQNAMGGASVAAPLDAATVITNPAGMAGAGARIDFGATYFDPTVKYRATGAASGAEQRSDRGASPVPAFGLVAKRGEDLYVGIGAYGIAGMGVDYRNDLFGSNLYTSYSQMRFAPGLAYRVLPNLTVGLVANVMYATMEYNAAGMYPRDSASAFGLGATMGVQYAPIDLLTIGLAYETRSVFQDFRFNIAPHQASDGQGGTVAVPGGVEKLSFDQPSVATLGVALRPLGGLVVAADLEWIRWSETNGENEPEFKTNPQLTGISPWNMSWSDQWVVKVGAEYAPTDLLRLRLGYNYGKMPLDAARGFENLAFPAIAEQHVSGGFGLVFGKLEVNAAFTWSPEAKLSGSQPAFGIASYSTRMSQVAFDLGIAHSF